jgi:hypothetical protein
VRDLSGRRSGLDEVQRGAMKNFYLAPLLLLFVGTGAQSQVVQESELELYDQSADGQPATCGVQFTFAFRDDVYGTILPGGTTG